MKKLMRAFTFSTILLVQSGHAFEFKNFQAQLEKAQSGLGRFIDAASKELDRQKEAQKTREKVQRDNEAVIVQAQIEAELAKTKDSTFLVKLENIPSSAKWLMIAAKKVNSENKEGDVSIVKITDRKVSQKIYLKEGAGEYNINYFYTTLNDRYKGVYTYLSLDKVKNLDNTDKQFLLPSVEVQSDDPRIIQIANRLKDGARDEIELVQRIHDFVVENISYNDEGYASGSYLNDETDAITVLLTRKTVCAGYSSFFAAIARAAGIKTAIIHGPAKVTKGWELHAWNEVFINGKWESIDVTWDDKSELSYEYFLIGEEKLKEDHKKESVQLFY